MATDYAKVTAAVSMVVRNASDGTPKAQRKMEARVRAAGALRTHLTTGTRGRYSLLVDVDSGWDPAQDARIGEGEPLQASLSLGWRAGRSLSTAANAGRRPECPSCLSVITP